MLSNAEREPTADEVAILRQFWGGVNARITSFSASYITGELPDIPDETYLKTSIVAYSMTGYWQATFWATKAGRALVQRLAGAADGQGE